MDDRKTIDAKSFLADVRTKYPALEKYPDDILLNRIKEHPEAIESQFPGISSKIGSWNFSTQIDHPENFLQRVMKGVGAFIPQSGTEALDVVKGVSRQMIPMGEGGKVSPATMGPFGAGLNVSGVKEIGGIPEPETDWGKVLENDFIKRAKIAIPAGLGAKAILKGGVELAFPKTIAKIKLPGKTKELSSAIQKVFKISKDNPELGVPKDMVIAKLESGLSKSKVPTGEQASLFRKWIKALKTDPKFGDKLDAETISEIETKFGKVAKWGKGVNDTILQNSAKDINRYASAKLDQIATKSGVPEFIKKSSEKSKLLSTISSKPSMLRKLSKWGLIGGASLLGLGKAGGKILDKFREGISDIGGGSD